MLCISCSDTWDEHYNSDTSLSQTTLWERIEASDNLTNFTRVAKTAAYDIILDASQTYTLFVPTDTYFSSAQADSIISIYNINDDVRPDDNPAIKQFLQNHISLYKKSISSLTNDTLMMMNSKYQKLSYGSIGNRTLLTTNDLCANGILFTIDGIIDYFPNIFEYLNNDDDLDSVYNFLNSYNVYEFDAARSVAGEIIDGQTEYLDSVFTLQNDIFNTLGKLNDEDSTYWMLVPTNNEWDRLVSEYVDYFNYDNTVNKRDSLQWSQSRQAILCGTVFSLTQNPKLANGYQNLSSSDSLISTSAQTAIVRQSLGLDNYNIYYDPNGEDGIFSGSEEEIICSNGAVIKAPDFGINKYNTFLQTIKVEAEMASNQDTIVNAEDPLTTVQVAEDNPFYGKISQHSYVEIIPTASDARPQVGFKIPNVLSNVPYDVKVVFVPAYASDTLASEDALLPNYFSVSLSYNDQNGMVETPRSISLKRYYTSDKELLTYVDTVTVIENYTIPTCSYSLTSSQVTLTVNSQVTPSQSALYSRTLRIDCILFEPHRE